MIDEQRIIALANGAPELQGEAQELARRIVRDRGVVHTLGAVGSGGIATRLGPSAEDRLDSLARTVLGRQAASGERG